MAFIGFGAGNAQLAAFALPELLPNKWRHIAIVIADIGVLFDVVVGPVVGRFAAVDGDSVSRNPCARRRLQLTDEVPVAMAVLRAHHLRRPVLHRIVPILLSSCTP